MCVQWRIGFQLLIRCFHDQQNSQHGRAIGKGLGEAELWDRRQYMTHGLQEGWPGPWLGPGPQVRAFLCQSQVHGWPTCYVTIPTLAEENQVVLMFYQLWTLWPGVSSNHAYRDLASLWNIPSEEATPKCPDSQASSPFTSSQLQTWGPSASSLLTDRVSIQS